MELHESSGVLAVGVLFIGVFDLGHELIILNDLLLIALKYFGNEGFRSFSAEEGKDLVDDVGLGILFFINLCLLLKR